MELSAILCKIIGSLLASADGPVMSDETVMEFVLTNVMEAKNAF
jgi:hypothetical protein